MYGCEIGMTRDGTLLPLKLIPEREALACNQALVRGVLCRHYICI